MGTESRRVPNHPHTLVVHEWDFDDPDGCIQVEHSEDCPAWGRRELGRWTTLGWECAVGTHVDAAGLETWFAHERDDRASNRDVEVLSPGRYIIEAYSEHVRTFEFDEWDGGLRTTDAYVLEPRAS